MSEKFGHDESFTFSRAGFANILVIIFVLIIGIAIGGFVFNNQTKINPQENNKYQKVPFSITKGNESSSEIIIYNENNIKITFLWPNANQYISNEEAEIRILNISNNSIKILNPFLTISEYKPASEGWEVFASKRDNEYIEKIIIYNSIPESTLTLKPKQFGKLHWHFLFDDNYAKQTTQTVNIKLNLKINNKIIEINKTLTKDVESVEGFDSTAAHPVSDYFEENNDNSH